MYRLLRGILFLLPAEVAHTLTLKLLGVLHSCQFLKKKVYTKPVTCMGIEFPNPVGLAAGLDRNADYIDALACFGFGFVEVGGVTPKPQPGNPKSRLFRLKEKRAIINRMGFNSKGLDVVVENLKKVKSDIIIGVNIGKNMATPLEDALDDYLICLERLYPHVHYIVINLSSPNTPGLRELQHGEYLHSILQSLKKRQAELHAEYKRYVPLVMKVAPDLSHDEIHSMSKILLQNRMDGLIVSNTSLARDEVAGVEHADEKGGLSGAPIFKQSTAVLTQFHSLLQDAMPLIGLGGIMSASDARQKFKCGASLVQIYTGFIYEGPSLIKDIVYSENKQSF